MCTYIHETLLISPRMRLISFLIQSLYIASKHTIQKDEHPPINKLTAKGWTMSIAMIQASCYL